MHSTAVAHPPAALPQANDQCWCGSGRKYKRCHKRTEGRVLPGIVSPMRTVPPSIPRPPYADTGEVVGWNEPRVKSSDIVERMRVAGRLAAEILRLAGEAVRPGLTTDELDEYVHQLYIDRDCYPSPLNYNGYPKSVCTSVNEIVAHGIPDDRELVAGDTVNCDVTIYLDGMHGDCSRTFCVGGVDAVDPATVELVVTTERALRAGIAAARPGGRVRDIGRAIQRVARDSGFGVVRELVGHGIGEQFHGEPHVHHYDEPRNRSVLRPGSSFTIEPMLTLGLPEVAVWDDGWTIATVDGLPSAQFEHTILVTESGIEVLTVATDGDVRYPVA